MAGETYDRGRCMELAYEPDEHTKLVEIALQRGETAWNPLSTKGPIYGPVIVKMVILRSGIQVGLYKLKRCVGMNQVRKPGRDYFEYEQCPHVIDVDKVRCEDHDLVGAYDSE